MEATVGGGGGLFTRKLFPHISLHFTLDPNQNEVKCVLIRMAEWKTRPRKTYCYSKHLHLC